MSKSPTMTNRFNSYQQGSYVAPGLSYAEGQTQGLGETLQTQYEAEATANHVLSTLHAQRNQLRTADGDVLDMRNATEETKRELRDLQAKYRARKRKLYGFISLLGLVDALLFYRIASCRGSFFC